MAIMAELDYYHLPEDALSDDATPVLSVSNYNFSSGFTAFYFQYRPLFAISSVIMLLIYYEIFVCLVLLYSCLKCLAFLNQILTLKVDHNETRLFKSIENLTSKN